MIIKIPKTQIEIRDKLRATVYRLVDEYNIRRSFVMDSQNIDSAIDTIAYCLYNIKENAKPELDKETLKRFKNIMKAKEK